MEIGSAALPFQALQPFPGLAQIVAQILHGGPEVIVGGPLASPRRVPRVARFGGATEFVGLPDEALGGFLPTRGAEMFHGDPHMFQTTAKLRDLGRCRRRWALVPFAGWPRRTVAVEIGQPGFQPVDAPFHGDGLVRLAGRLELAEFRAQRFELLAEFAALDVGGGGGARLAPGLGGSALIRAGLTSLGRLAVRSIAVALPVFDPVDGPRTIRWRWFGGLALTGEGERGERDDQAEAGPEGSGIWKEHDRRVAWGGGKSETRHPGVVGRLSRAPSGMPPTPRAYNSRATQRKWCPKMASSMAMRKRRGCRRSVPARKRQ